MGRALENVTDGMGDLRHRHPPGVLALDQHPPLARFEQSNGMLHQGRLASPIGTEYRNHIPPADNKVDIVQHRWSIRISKIDIFEL